MSNALHERMRFLSCLLMILMGTAGCGSGLDTREQDASENSEPTSTGQQAPAAEEGFGTPILDTGDAVVIRIDATALSHATFKVDSRGWSPTRDILELSLPPGQHSIYTSAYSAGSNQVSFTVTPAGTVDYSPEDDGVLGGRGTSTLIVRGVTVQIDATALSNARFSVDNIQWYPRTTVLTLTLLPGQHDFFTSSYTVGLLHLYFTVTRAGTVDYSPEDDGVLGGRGTSTLVVRGVTVQIDATALSNASFSVDSIQWYPRTTVLTLTLLPGQHDFFTSSYTVGLLHLYFTVTRAGTVDYSPEDDGVLGGRGTSTLIVRGVTVRVDATALSNASFGVDGIQWYPCTTVLTLTLLPGQHDFFTSAHTLGLLHLYFTVTRAGTVDYSPEDDGVLGGRGTSTLIVKGVTVRVDATALSNERFGIDGIQWYSQATVLTLTLLPGQHDFFTQSGSAGLNHTTFVVKRDWTIDYAPALNGVLAGRGTNTLLLRGAVIFVDARGISGGQLNVDGSGWLTTSFMVPYALMPGRHELLLPANGPNSTLYFDVLNDGTVSYSPDEDGTIFSGHGTDTLVVLNTSRVGQLDIHHESLH